MKASLHVRNTYQMSRFYGIFLNIGRQNHRPGISLVFIRRAGKPAVLGQHSRWIKQICSVWHQVAARHLKSFRSPTNLPVLWKCCAPPGVVRHYISLNLVTMTTPLPLFFFNVTPSDFSSINTSFWMIIPGSDVRQIVLTLIPAASHGTDDY